MHQAEGIYNIGTGQEISLVDLITAIQQVSGLAVDVKHKEAILGEVKRSCLDFSKAKKDLSWQPQYSLKQGLDLTYRWFKEKR